MAITVSNFAVRQITCDKDNIQSYGDWSTSANSIQTGYYNNAYKYVAQFRFRFDKPCSSFAFQFYTYGDPNQSWYGTSYWKVSSKEQDDILAKGSVVDGAPYDAVVTHTANHQIQTATFTGPFTADTDYYLYGFNYGTSWNCCKFYAFYDDNYTSKIIETVDLVGAVYIDNGVEFDVYQIYIDNGVGWDLYIPYIDNGTSWDLYS